MSFSKSFNELFVIPEDKGMKWEEDFFKYRKKANKEKIVELIKSANELYFDERQIYTAINRFTLKTVSEEKKNKLFDMLKEEDFVEDVQVDDSTVIINTKKEKIIAIKLTSMVPTLTKEDENIETEKRRGTCHKNAIKISKSLGIPNEVVTGFVFGYCDKTKYLHSWVEFNYRNEECVIDYTLNAFMNKDGYYYMQHAIPISRVSDKNIVKDDEIIQKFRKLGNFNLKEYLVFRDEIMKDFEKNKTLFDEER